MTKRFFWTSPPWIPLALLTTATAATACGNGDDTVAPVPTLDATTADVNVTPSFAGIRVANWVPDLTAPAIDICLSPRGLDLFQGPVLAGGNLVFVPDGGPPDDATIEAFFATEDDAGANGVAFGQMSVYASVPVGPYDVRFVVASAPDCSQPIAPDLLNAGAFAAATLTTVAIYGMQDATDPSVAVSSMLMVDDAILAGTSKTAVRFVNALAQLPWSDGTTIDAPVVDFGTGYAVDSGVSTSLQYKPLYIGVPYGGISDKSQTQLATQSATASVDSHGYGSVTPLSPTGFSAHRSGAIFDIAETSSTLSIGGGTIVTAVLLPQACTTSDTDAGCGYPAQIAVYIDNAVTIGSPLTECVTCAEAGSP